MQEPNNPESLYGSGEQQPHPVAKAPGIGDQLGIFTEPVALFRRLEVTPRWGAAFGVFATVNFVMGVIWSRRVDMEEFLTPILEKRHVPPERMEAAIQFSKSFMPVQMLVGALFLFLACLFMGLIYWSLGQATNEGKAPTYRHALSATTVTGLVNLPKLLILGIICARGNFGGSTPDALFPLSVGYFLAPENHRLHTALNVVDPFLAASLVLLYLAARHIMRLKPLGAALCVVASALGMIGMTYLFAN